MHPGYFRELSLGCHGHTSNRECCRIGHGRRAAPGDPCHAAGAVCPGDADRDVDKKAVRGAKKICPAAIREGKTAEEAETNARILRHRNGRGYAGGGGVTLKRRVGFTPIYHRMSSYTGCTGSRILFTMSIQVSTESPLRNSL